MCDAECQTRMLAKAKEEAAEAENIVLLVTFFLLVSLVYITGQYNLVAKVTIILIDNIQHGKILKILNVCHREICSISK